MTGWLTAEQIERLDPEAGTDVPAARLTLDQVARLALPLETRDAEVSTEFDRAQQRWTVSSPEPNLRITGTFGGEVGPNVLGVGFFFELLSSFVSVAEVAGRHVLRDGYRRCYRLLAAGVTARPSEPSPEAAAPRRPPRSEEARMKLSSAS